MVIDEDVADGGDAASRSAARSVRQTSSRIVGVGPAGAMLTLLLARQGIPEEVIP